MEPRTILLYYSDFAPKALVLEEQLQFSQYRVEPVEHVSLG
jgi:hypothetical protein